jgi:hypothetical protein
MSEGLQKMRFASAVAQVVDLGVGGSIFDIILSYLNPMVYGIIMSVCELVGVTD